MVEAKKNPVRRRRRSPMKKKGPAVEEPYVRIASHAGDWYPSDPAELKAKLSGLFAEAVATKRVKACTRSGGTRTIKALIVPHAGLEYSGSTQAKGYINLTDSNPSTIFLLGPSHHTSIDSCALTVATHLETPLGDLEVDTEIVAELK